MPSSFIYEDLVSHVEKIRNQMFEMMNMLNHQRKRDELKVRSLVFIDPYGNQIVTKYMGHELINNIIEKYKKEYIPKYLQKWIRIGMMKENQITTLNDDEQKSNVAKYADGCQFISYGLVPVCISTDEIHQLHQFLLPVLLMNSMEKIKLQIKDLCQFTDMELKLCKINENTWNEGNILKSEDTIMSCELYQGNSIIVAKILNNKTDDIFPIFIKTLTGIAYTLEVYSSMKVLILKELLCDKTGLHVDLQRFVFIGQKLEDEKSLGDYNIEKEATIYVKLRLTGGMYHFTSGRQGFNDLPYDSIKAIEYVLEFKIKDSNQLPLLSSAELQNSVIQIQDILFNLFNTIKKVHVRPDLPDLNDILLSTLTDIDQSNN